METHFETAVVGGGCFWCVEAVINEIAGVVSVTSGYAGGEITGPTYRKVCTGATNHAEVVQVVFDASLIHYADLLQIFLLMHNPTQRSIQEKKGGQYRSIIFYSSIQQKRTAEQTLRKMQNCFDAPILTEIEPLKTFYEAEERHQAYYKSDPSNPYCQTVIAPKLAALRQKFLSHLKPALAT